MFYLIRRIIFFPRRLFWFFLFVRSFYFGDGRFISLFLGTGGLLVFAFLFYLLWISDFFRCFFGFLLINLPTIILLGFGFFLWGFLWLYLLYRHGHRKRLIARDFSDYSIYPYFVGFVSFFPSFFVKLLICVPVWCGRIRKLFWNINVYLFLYGVLVYFTICLLLFALLLFYYAFVFLYPDGLFYPFFKEIPWELFFTLGFDRDLLGYFYSFILKLVGIQRERIHNIYKFFIRFRAPLFEGGENRMRWPTYEKISPKLRYLKKIYGRFVSFHYVFFNSPLRFPVVQVIFSIVFSLLALEWTIYALYRNNRHLSNFKSPKEVYLYRIFVRKFILSIFFGFFLVFLAVFILIFFLSYWGRLA